MTPFLAGFASELTKLAIRLKVRVPREPKIIKYQSTDKGLRVLRRPKRLKKLATTTTTGPSRDPFLKVDNARKNTVFKGDMSKTQGPQELRSRTFPDFEQVANTPYRERVHVLPNRPLDPFRR